MIRKLKIKFILINMTIVTAMLLVIFGMVLRSTSADMERQSTMNGDCGWKAAWRKTSVYMAALPI